MRDFSACGTGKKFSEETHRGFKAFGVFLFLAAAIASIAGATLIWRGTVLDRIWVLNRNAYSQLAPLGRIVGVAFLMLGAVMLIAGLGWKRRRLWGWRLGLGILVTQALGDLVNCLRGDFLRGSIGLAISVGLLLYLRSRTIRSCFAEVPSSP
jgi:hypothetical protein